MIELIGSILMIFLDLYAHIVSFLILTYYMIGLIQKDKVSNYINPVDMPVFRYGVYIFVPIVIVVFISSVVTINIIS